METKLFEADRLHYRSGPKILILEVLQFRLTKKLSLIVLKVLILEVA